MNKNVFKGLAFMLCLFFCNYSNAQSLFLSSDYYSKLNVIDLDYIPIAIRTNLKLGKGYDMSDPYYPAVADNSPFIATGQSILSDRKLVPKVINIKTGAKDIDYNFEENVSEETIAKFFHAELKIKFPSIDIRGSLDYTRRQYAASKAVRFWLQSLEAPVTPELNTTWSFEPITEKSQITNKDDLWKLFKGTYGTHFVTALNLGYRIEMVAIATESSNDSKLKISSAFRAWKAKGKFDAEISQQIKESKVDIYVKIFCGEIKNTTTGSTLPFIVTGIDDVLKFLDELKSNTIQITPAPVTISVKSYFASVCSKFPNSCKLFEAKLISTAPSLIPKGTIIAWHPSNDNKVIDSKGNLVSIIVPDGWIICDGNNNTPNLNGVFLLGTIMPNEVNDIGGVASHSHSVTGSTDGPGPATERHGTDGGKDFESMGISHTHTYSGRTNEVTNLPPYNKVIYLMKIN